MNRLTSALMTFMCLLGAIAGTISIGAVLMAVAEKVQAQAAPGQPMAFLGYCQLTSLGSSTALASCSGGIPTNSNAVVLKAEAQALRYRPDGVTTAPSATVGMPIATADAPLLIQSGSTGLTALRFIEQVSGGKLNVLFYRAPQ
jgi:hypothetical protein